jgi:hypothetical protein
MDYCSHEEIAFSKIFNIRISDNELQLYEQCIYYVLNNCDDKGVYATTGCMSRKELSWFWQEVAELVWEHLIHNNPIDALDTEYVKRLKTALDDARKNSGDEDDDLDYAMFNI